MNSENPKSLAGKTFRHLFFLFCFLFSIFTITSCVSYPDIPEVNRMKEVEEAKPSKGKEEESIAKVFEKKVKIIASSFKSHEPKDYRIGPEDVLQVQVWDHDDLTRTVKVSREGEFSYPLIGRVHADGVTVSELEKDIRTKLSGRFIINPQVTISVNSYESKRIYILGEVGGPQSKGQGPGVYPLTGETTLVEILSKAGGPTQDAGDDVIVVRPRNVGSKGSPIPLEKAGEGEVITLNLRKLLEGDERQNILLKHGDTIYLSKAEYFFVVGEVKREGRYKLEKGTTVLKGITTAGGFTDKAAKGKVMVLREGDGKKIKIPVKMTDLITAQDVIMVPESFF
ncbi:MAG: polysaccharide biosynthesis/export family protein [Thermodesulfobacteriota bacterium]